MSSEHLSDQFENSSHEPLVTPAHSEQLINSQLEADEFEAESSAGDIGEEQLPAADDAGSKTDKQVWNYSADQAAYGSSLGQLFRQFFKGQ